ncbi:hypothetical protein BJV74DRAFT_892065 [Russula compacta]|nr:hypothetical protein BJV74DRAFT_892065 [Russula compacta]
MLLKTLYLYLDEIGAKLNYIVTTTIFSLPHVSPTLPACPYYAKGNPQTIKSLGKSKFKDAKIWEAGHARLQINLVFGQQLAKQAQRKEEEEVGKAHRASNREVQRVAKAAAEAEWKKKKEEYEEAMESWKAECLRLWAENMWVKDLPPKPRAPCRPKPPSEAPGSQAGPSSEAGDRTDDDCNDHD